MMAHNRRFLRRAVQFAMRAGIRQFIDIGSGIPTVGNVHEVAHEIDPETRVVYVDNDMEAVVTGQEMLRGSDVAVAISGDLRRPESILDHPETQRLIDFTEPVGLLMVAVLHFISDEENPRALLHRYLDRLRPGSYLLLSHGSYDETTPLAREQAMRLEREYGSTSNPTYPRGRDAFMGLVDGLDLVEPGVAYAADWRNDEPRDLHDVSRPMIFAAVGMKS